MREYLTQGEMRKLFATFVRRHRFKAEASRRLGIAQSVLCDILSGKREVQENIATMLGYQRTVVFIPTQTVVGLKQAGEEPL